MPFQPQRFIHAANVRLDVPVSVHLSEQLTEDLRHALEDATLTDSAADAAVRAEGYGILLRTLYPAAPHLAHALWTPLGFAARHGDLVDAPWPAVDEAALVRSEIELVLQVGGKLRGSITVPASADLAAIEAAALANPDAQRFMDGKPVRKVVIVPGRLVNIVV